jgi:hypothetical protein
VLFIAPTVLGGCSFFFSSSSKYVFKLIVSVCKVPSYLKKKWHSSLVNSLGRKLLNWQTKGELSDVAIQYFLMCHFVIFVVGNEAITNQDTKTYL